MKNEFKLRFFLTFTSIILLLFLSNIIYSRYDFTKQKNYTLSPYTINLLKSLDSTAEITWFKSSSLELFIPQTQYLFDVLKEYELTSKGNCIAVQKNTDGMEDEVLTKLGIVPKKIETNDGYNTSFINIYSGIMLEFKGITKVIPFAASISNIEYDLANFILQIKNERSKNILNGKLYLLLPENTQDDYIHLKSWLEYSGFQIEKLNPPFSKLDTQIPLFVAGSQVDENSAAAIEVFLQKKGSAVFFISGNSIDVKGKWKAKAKTKNALIKILEEKGFEIQTDLVLDLANFKLTMNAADGSSYETINYPFWITLLRENIYMDSTLFSGITGLQTFWPSSLKINTEKNKNAKPFWQTTKSGILMKQPYNTEPFGTALSLFTQSEKEKRIIIAGEDNSDSRLLVISDENCIGNAIEYTDSAGNLDFAVNCAEWISFKDNLLNLKNKKHEFMPFKYFEDVNQFYSIIKRARIICFIILPILILCTAIYISIYFRRIHFNETSE